MPRDGSSTLLIKNVRVLQPDGFHAADILLQKRGPENRPARIADLQPPGHLRLPEGASQLDGRGLLAAPGFIDLQINGAFGRDFTREPDSIWAAAEELPRFGVTGFLATLISSAPETAAAAQAALQAGPPLGFRGAQPLGLHLEGPFLNPERCGAHLREHLRLPELKLVENWEPAQGVRWVTLAPELPGALELIRELKGRGVVVSAGHSTADYETARAGIAAGISAGTHLFNAMPPLGHRQPGLVGALLRDPAVCVGLIVDGLHLHPAVVELVWRQKKPAGLFLVSDAMAALGAAPGAYPLGDQVVQVDYSAARLPDGRLAGSLLSMDAAVRNLVAFCGCTLAEAVACASSNPARAAGLARYGVLRPGFAADVVLLSEEGEVQATIAAAEVVFSRL